MKGREENEVLDAEESFAIRSYIEAVKKFGNHGRWLYMANVPGRNLGSKG